MKGLVSAVAIAAVIGFLAQPLPVDAQEDDGNFDRCLQSGISACDEAFPRSGLLSTTARGWCYLGVTATCALE